MGRSKGSEPAKDRERGDTVLLEKSFESESLRTVRKEDELEADRKRLNHSRTHIMTMSREITTNLNQQPVSKKQESRRESIKQIPLQMKATRTTHGEQDVDEEIARYSESHEYGERGKERAGDESCDILLNRFRILSALFP